jgi:hypothetical protein
LRYLFDIIAAIGVIYAIADGRRTKQQLTTQQQLLTSKDFQDGIGALIQTSLLTAFKAFEVRVEAIAHNVYNTRLLELMREKTRS